MADGYAQQAYRNETAPPAPRTTAVDRIAAAEGALADTVKRLDGLFDAVFGSAPPAVEKNPALSVARSHCVLSTLEEAADRIHALRVAINHRIDHAQSLI